MMLVPKDTPWLKPPVPFLPDPSFQWGRGEQATPDPNKFLTHELVDASRLDRAMHVMEAMKSIEGQGQPPKMPWYKRKSSEYF